MTTTKEEQRRGRRVKGLIAGAAGVALLLGGSTFALWSANDSLAGGTIKAGDLNITKKGDVAFYDISPDRTDHDGESGVTFTATGSKGHPITNLANHLIVPADVVAGVYNFDVTLVGENLVADLTGSFTETTAAQAFAKLNMSYDAYLIVNSVSTTLKTGQPMSDVTSFALGSVQAYETTDARIDKNAGSALPMVHSDGKATVKVVVKATFDDSTPDRDDVGADKALASLKVTLTQSRTTGNGNFS
jgi:alternate signal-mediated exported protein